MAEKHPKNPEQSQPIHPSTFAQFSSESLAELYANFSKKDPGLASWVRQRAVELYPDIETRDRPARLALELAALLTLDAAEEQARIEDIERIQAMLQRPSVQGEFTSNVEESPAA